MATTFSSLPIVDLSLLSEPTPSPDRLRSLSRELYDVFTTTGFAYLVNSPITFSHEQVFNLAKDFFRVSDEEKRAIAKKTFVKQNRNTYRGYFPTQPGQQDNLKEGFEIGPAATDLPLWGRQQKFNLSESNVWPAEQSFPTGRERLEALHFEMQSLASTLLSLLAISLGQSCDFFSSYLDNSISTLRLLHYPPQARAVGEEKDPQLCCTPHTDSGILTLLHQDSTGGLEVLNANSEWVPAPYVPGSVVVNIGDLMAEVSGGRFVATMHRVRASSKATEPLGGMGRFSVPFFFEPGEACIIRSVDAPAHGGILYGEHVRRKMGTWVEFQDVPDDAEKMAGDQPIAIAVY